MNAYMFPGQGSQKKGMGSELFSRYKDLVAKADSILGYSIEELCLEDPNNQLGQTQFTQPALYVVNAMTYLHKVEETGNIPDFVAGHSLGEYSALFAAGVYDFETGLKLVKFRGQMMSEAKGGGMAAVIGLTADQIQNVLQDNSLSTIDVANLNSAKQIVLSGLKDDILAAKSFFEKCGAMLYIPLNVSGAFHSRYMKEPAEKFQSFIDEFEFSEPEITVIANVSALPYKTETIKENLYKQIFSSVLWLKSIQYMLDQGVEDFEEMGPGNVLTKLVQKIKSGS